MKKANIFTIWLAIFLTFGLTAQEVEPMDVYLDGFNSSVDRRYHQGLIKEIHPTIYFLDNATDLSANGSAKKVYTDLDGIENLYSSSFDKETIEIIIVRVSTDQISGKSLNLSSLLDYSNLKLIHFILEGTCTDTDCVNNLLNPLFSGKANSSIGLTYYAEHAH